VFEPLRIKAAREAGIGWHTVEGRSVTESRSIEFIERALRGKVRNSWTMRDNSVRSVLTARTWIVKEVRVNRILPWIVRHFGLDRGVLLIRDPYAVISSQLALAGEDAITTWLGTPRVTAPDALVDAYPWLGDIAIGEDDAVSQLALQWALDQLVPLSDPSPSWSVLGYEALQRDPVGGLAPVFERWGVPVPRDIEQRAAVPSSVTRSAPRHELEEVDRRRVQAVCRAVGLVLSDDRDGGPCVRIRSDLAVMPASSS
jgi:hypothetical protein